jgi:aspartyl-tRNA(Asn)/glutamyl-tRNA(Gln) amidotransferase subunit C
MLQLKGCNRSTDILDFQRWRERKKPKMTARVTVEEVERVAELANVELTAAETEAMLHDLNAILDYVATLNELDTSGVAPLAQVSELEGAGGASSLRPDAVAPSLDRSAVMPEAPETDRVFFKVPKVIER